jgi:hypothetical protein
VWLGQRCLLLHRVGSCVGGGAFGASDLGQWDLLKLLLLLLLLLLHLPPRLVLILLLLLQSLPASLVWLLARLAVSPTDPQLLLVLIPMQCLG